MNKDELNLIKQCMTITTKYGTIYKDEYYKAFDTSVFETFGLTEKLIVAYWIFEVYSNDDTKLEMFYLDTENNIYYNKKNGLIMFNINTFNNLPKQYQFYPYFSLLHEIRHSQQKSKKKESFYIDYTGKGYYTKDDLTFSAQITTDPVFSLALYSNQPIEKDANHFAYTKLKKILQMNQPMKTGETELGPIKKILDIKINNLTVIFDVAFALIKAKYLYSVDQKSSNSQVISLLETVLESIKRNDKYHVPNECLDICQIILTK